MSEEIQRLENTLRRMTITLGDPTLQYVVGNEGNTSVKTDDGKRMVIKAGGTTFLNPRFVVVDVERALHMLAQDYTAAQISEKMKDVVIDFKGAKPSKEVTLHAVLNEYKWIVHTHAREIEGFVCSKAADNALRRSQHIKRLEEISRGSIAWASYASPGTSLAREAQKAYDAYVKRQQDKPQAIFLQNHGLVVGSDDPSIVEKQTGKYVAAVSTMRSEIRQDVSAETMMFGGLGNFGNSKCKDLSRMILEKLRKMDCEDIKPCNSRLMQLLVRSRKGKERILAGNIAPEQIQSLGIKPVWVDYDKSAPKLLRNVESALTDHRRIFDSTPKILYVEGLGTFAIGESHEEAKIICDTAEKIVDVLMRTIPFGGPRYLTKRQEDFYRAM